MRRFNELQFEPHQSGLGGQQARLNFPNGYGVSVITGEMFYSEPEKPYEVAVLYKDALCYNTPITNDVIGYQTEDEVEGIMNQVAELPAPKDAA